MATVLLAAAGSAAGGSLGGSLLGIGASVLGKAAGATAGAMLDQSILGTGAKAVETGRARSLRLQTSTEGTALPRIFGRMRVAGQVIWSTRFKEHVRTTSYGGKSTGGQTVREYSYTVSFAVALAEGPIDRVGRIWADGKPFIPPDGVMRVYLGTDDQLPDPKIEAVEGTVPAHRGTAYVVFEDLAVGPYGNRIPQLSFEVFRSPAADLPVDPEERGLPLPELITAVAMSPGTGEFSLEPDPVQIVEPGQPARYANINNTEGRPDMQVAFDQLDADLPGCEAVSLVVSWFGDDLRVGRCRVEPKAEERDRPSAPVSWSVAGLTTGNARLVSRSADGRVNFGGTPSDGSIIRSIAELNARGKKVMLYPFLLMDISEGNGLPDPYGRLEQPVFPWRGRITLEQAPGRPGTSDKTTAAAAEVAAFFGSARASDFTVADGKVSYSGPDEWTWRRFVLHLAALGQAAGGVESLCIGTELRGVTTIRDGAASYPAVAELIDLAAEVRQLLPGAKLSYAADWSEYFGHQPADGSGDAIFHLDPLWADPNIDFIGIDDYTPLSDWRHGSAHLDREEGAPSIYSLPYLKANVEGGEYYDFYYQDQTAREQQTRSPIVDGAHGEDWIFRPKDIRNWWSNAHHNRIGGVRQASPTPWVPGSKPVRLTETGCPACDLGANQPNVFYDGRSSESALPHFSLGARDDEMQRRFLQAKLGHWTEPGVNPVSGAYGGPMIEDIYVWTWDARPWPDFPLRESVWADGPSWRLGHWITGRISSSSLAEIVAEICMRAGLSDIDVGALYGTVEGYLIERTEAARESLQPLMLAYGFDAFESAGRIVFRMRGQATSEPLDERWLVAEDETGPVERSRDNVGVAPAAVRVTYLDANGDYRLAAAEAKLPSGAAPRVSETSLPIAIPSSRALGIAERWLSESARGRDVARFSLPPSALELEPSDHVSFAREGFHEVWRIERITETVAREVEAVRVEPSLYAPVVHAERSVEPPLLQPAGPLQVVLLDLQVANGTEIDHQPWIAAAAEPWEPLTLWRSVDGASFEPALDLRRPALIGRLLDPLPLAGPDRWAHQSARLAFAAGALQSRSRLAVLNGENRLAIELENGEWEIVQFQEAVLTAPGEIEISTLLRGQRGTAPLVSGTIPAGRRVVVLDEAIQTLPVPLEELGLPRVWRIGPRKHDHAHPSYLEIMPVPGGLGLRPFAPAHLKARRETGGDIEIDWVRTTRVGGDGWQGPEVPLGEDREVYRIEIRSAGGLLRRAESEAPRFTYDAAMQAADSAAGGLEVRVSQLSNAYGYGLEGVVFIDG